MLLIAKRRKLCYHSYAAIHHTYRFAYIVSLHDDTAKSTYIQEATMGKIKGLHHLSIYVKDMEESLNFYCITLGFELLDQETCDFGEFALIRKGDCTMELILPPDPEAVKWNRGVIDHFGLDIEGIDDVYAEMKEKGLKITTDGIVDMPRPLDGGRVFCAEGPNGEGINFYEFNRKI